MFSCYIEIYSNRIRSYEYYKRSNYYDSLTQAREEGLAEPDIPPLDNETIEQVSNLYIEIFEKITGKKFFG